jgi:hypothetical protein
MNTGSCLCGAVRYEVAGPFDMMAHCHCSMCRKHHGAMFATFASAPLAGFRWVAGEDQIASYQSSADGHRGFCRHCGSVMPMVMKEMGLVIVPAGNLDGDPGIKPQMHMFAGSRAAWFPITDQLPQHRAYPPQFGGGDGIERPAPRLQLGIVQGSCLCNETAWEFSGPPERVQNCHCSRCRKARSAAHATNAFFKQEQLRWVRGQGNVQNHALKGARYFGQDFCRLCGSPVPRVVQATGYVVTPCGTLDSALPMLPLGNVFAASKAPWYEITDGLPQWDGYPPKK